jgi:hypothetical protein
VISTASFGVIRGGLVNAAAPGITATPKRVNLSHHHHGEKAENGQSEDSGSHGGFVF